MDVSWCPFAEVILLTKKRVARTQSATWAHYLATNVYASHGKSVVAKWPGAIRRPSDTNHDGNDVQASTSNRQSCVLVQSTATRWCKRLNHKSIVISRPTSPCLTEGAPGVVTAEDPVLRFVRGLDRSLVRTESRPLAVASENKHKSKRYHVIL